jgi:Phage tail tube protein
MLKKRCYVACEIEASEGTAETIVAADVFLAFDPEFEPVIEPHERDPKNASLSPFPSVFGARSAKMKFKAELVGPAAAGSAIHISDALRACGFAETLVASTSATYLPASSSIPSATLGLYVDGKQFKIWGARGTVRLVLEKGKPGIFEFEFTGADWSEADASLPTGVSLESTIPPAFQGASLTINSYAALVGRVEIDMANAVALRPDANASSGHKSAVITGRKPTMAIDPEDVLVATHDFLGTWRAGTQVAFTTSIGSGAGEVIGITAPKVQYQGITQADRDGVAALDISALLCRNSGDDEVQIQIT